MKQYKLTKKELELMNIFWDTEDPLTAKQIHERYPNLVLSTIQVTLNNLIEKEAIKISEINYSGKTLTRSFEAIVSREDFILTEFSNIDISKLVSSFLGRKRKNKKGDEIEKIETVLEKTKKNIRNSKK